MATIFATQKRIDSVKIALQALVTAKQERGIPTENPDNVAGLDEIYATSEAIAKSAIQK